MESINVKNDIELILNLYKILANKNNFILEKRNNEMVINIKNFIFLLKIFNDNEKKNAKKCLFIEKI